MRPARHVTLPLGPLLHAYQAAHVPSLPELPGVPGLGPRFEAVLSASARFLSPDFLDRATDPQVRDALLRFHEAIAPFHHEVVRDRAGFLRHAVSFLLRGQASWPEKLHAVLSPDGPYRVPGLGPAFWSAVAQGTCPTRLPAWTHATWAGLERFGLAPLGGAAGPGDRYGCLIDAHVRIRRLAPRLTSLHIDHFLALAGHMTGRDLFSGQAALTADAFGERAKRGRGDLRALLKAQGQRLADGQEAFARALNEGDSGRLREALAAADPTAARRPLDEALIAWAGKLWHAEEPYSVLEALWRELPGAPLWLPAAVLHLRDPLRFAPYGEKMRSAQAALDDGADPGDPPATRYRLFNAVCDALREKHALHPLQLPFVLAEDDEPASRPEGFLGFCRDTFSFLDELGRNNARTWMEQQRDRYHFAVRGPLVELCRALASRYVEPVLVGAHGWAIDTRAEAGHALTSVCKNSYGRGGPYASALWITFCRPGRAGAQLFVRLDAGGLRWGLMPRGDVPRLVAALERNGDLVARLLRERGAPLEVAPLAWARGRDPEIAVSAACDDARLRSPGLADEIAETFDRLLPLFVCCQDEAPGPTLRRLAGQGGGGYAEGEFRRDTYLGNDWLARAVDLLRLKKQLILQGVPGTGKTHVARCLAKLLTGGDDEAVRLVQFHPSFSYEEFVEGIKARSVEVDGRHDVTYPVEDGILCSFAARAAACPSRPHVLVIDEINRGNLPRIFGELLYLLEYRGQAVQLPYSRRGFSLPPNLYLIGTMNAADRSIAPLDQALRRRFSFLPMGPDADVLTTWLAANPPREGPGFSSRVVGLFCKLNDRLRSEVGAHAQVGHSYFMVPHLDEPRLRMVWRHHVRPLLEELYVGQPGRAEACEQLLDRPARSRPTT